MIKLRIWDVFGNIEEDIPITSIERHPKGIKKGWVRINLAYGQYAMLQKNKLRQNIVKEGGQQLWRKKGSTSNSGAS